MTFETESTRHQEAQLSRRMFLFGRCLAEDETGVTAIEYGLLGALVSVAGLMSLTKVRGNIRENMRCSGRVIKAKKIGKKCKKAGF